MIKTDDKGIFKTLSGALKLRKTAWQKFKLRLLQDILIFLVVYKSRKGQFFNKRCRALL